VIAPTITVAQVVELVEEAQNAQNDLKYDQAEKLWRQVIKLQPNDAAAYAYLGSVLFSQDRIDEGTAAYKQAIKFKPSAKIYISYGESLRTADKQNEAIGAYKEALKLDSNSEVARIGLASVYIQQEKYTEAITEIRQAIAIKSSWDKYDLLGDTLSKAEKYDEARAAYRQAIKMEPTYSWLYVSIAETYKKQSKVNDAIAAYREAINSDSRNITAYTELAELITFPKSIAILAEYAKQEPRNDVPLQALGSVYRENQKLNESITAYRQAIKIKPSAENYASLGDVLQEQNKLEEAATAYRQVIQLEPQDYRYSALAEVLVKQKKVNEALTYCQTVINNYQKEDTYYKSHNTCSTAGFGIYQNQGIKNVISTYKQLAKKVVPKDMATIYVNLGYRIQNIDNFNKDDVISVLEEALKLDPKNKEAQENLKQLRETQASTIN
jgi:tetratricopeptide (TPR) repeat protein